MNTKRAPWLEFSLILLVPVVGLALGVAITALLGIGQSAYGYLVANLFFLAACVGLWRALAFTRQDLGLEILKQHTRWHLFTSLTACGLYVLFYVFAIRISGLKPLSSATAWGFLTYLVVALAEELYFRGMLYSIIEKHFSARAALIVTSLLFGLFHVRQGFGRALSRAVSGWLWGSVRYSSGMIFLLIFPVHFLYNTAWLLFEGNWSNPPTWAIYALPAAEYLLGFTFLFIHDIVRTD